MSNPTLIRLSCGFYNTLQCVQSELLRSGMQVTIIPSLLLLSVSRQSYHARSCNTKTDKSSALLYAHRCYLRDVPIPVPVPHNIIPDIIVPSHVVVPRCSG